jgi:hypothetical protein
MPGPLENTRAFKTIFTEAIPASRPVPVQRGRRMNSESLLGTVWFRRAASIAIPRSALFIHNRLLDFIPFAFDEHQYPSKHHLVGVALTGPSLLQSKQKVPA